MKRMLGATSSGPPMRAMGVRSRIHSSYPSFASRCGCSIGVRT